MHILSMLLVLGLALTGCSVKGVSDLTVQEVTALEDWRICYLNRKAPVGFIPLELNRRGLTCREEAVEERILRESAAKLEPTSVLVGEDVPENLLPDGKCEGIRLSVNGIQNPVVRPDRIEGELNKFSQFVAIFTVHNLDAAQKYVHIRLTYMDGYEKNKLVRVRGYSQSNMSYAFGLSSPLKSVAIRRCRAFPS